MKKEEYMNRVAEIFETLAFAIQDFNEGKLSVKEMQSIIRKAWEDKPKGWMLVDDDLAETLDLDESIIGEVISTEQFEGPEERAWQQEMVDNIIAEVNEWTGGSCSCSIYGSNSFIQNIIGEAEWEYLR